MSVHYTRRTTADEPVARPGHTHEFEQQQRDSTIWGIGPDALNPTVYTVWVCRLCGEIGYPIPDGEAP